MGYLTALAAFFLSILNPSLTLALDQASPRIYVADLKGTIDPATEDYLEQVITVANSQPNDIAVGLILIKLDTPGGLIQSVRGMARAIDESKVPVVVWVTPAGSSATSAGALLSLAAHGVVMSEGTHIGAAHPVDSNGKDIPGTMGEKVVSDTAAFARTLAEKRGRDVGVAEQFVRQSLSLTAREALQKGLVDRIIGEVSELDGLKVRGVKDRGEVILSLKRATPHAVEMSMGQKVLHFLANPNVAALLIALGTLGLYVEITTPGISFPGIFGVISLLVGFMSFQLLPIRTGGLLLLVLGVAFGIAELFVASHGMLAFGGVVAWVLGLLWVMDPSATTHTVSLAIVVPTAIALLAAAFGLMLLARRTQGLVSRALSEIKGGAVMGLQGYTGHVESVEGWISDSGASRKFRAKVNLRGEVWDVSSDDELKIGDSVEVMSQEHFIVHVRLIR